MGFGMCGVQGLWMEGYHEAVSVGRGICGVENVIGRRSGGGGDVAVGVDGYG
jgi:hypothetical protein